MNVIDVIDLDDEQRMESSLGDNDEDIDSGMKDETNGSLKDNDMNEESLDNHEIQESIDENEDNDEEINEELNEEINEELNDMNDDNEELNELNEELNEENEDNEEEIIEEDEDIVISDDDNSQSTGNLSNKFSESRNAGESMKSFEATPNDSMDSTSMASNAQQSTKKSLTKRSSKEEQNGDEIEVLSVNESDQVKEKQADMSPEINDEETGFPEYMKKNVLIGKRVAINKKTWSNIDVDGSDSILDCPSQVVPLMIQKPNKFPEKLKEIQSDAKSDIPSLGGSQNSKNMLTIADFYTSSVGKLLVGLGLSRAKQWYHKDAINKVKKQIRREGEVEDLVDELKTQQEYYAECRAANSSYVFPTDKCEHCDFKTEFNLVMEGHMSFPHLTSRREYKCNYCLYMTRDPKQIVLHTQALHTKKCLIEIPPQLYECPVCPYESGVKSKAATHITKCLKFFNADKLLTLNESEFPTITPKPITQEDIKIYEATLQALRFAALNPQTKVPHIPGLPTGLQQQMLFSQQQQLGVRMGPGRPPKQMLPMQKPRAIAPLTNNPYGSKNVSPQLYQMLSTVGGHTQLVAIQNRNNSHMAISGSNAMKNSNAKPNILSKANNPQMRPSNDGSAQKSGTFVICEICDGYIKDLEQLRTHMQWIHKV